MLTRLQSSVLGILPGWVVVLLKLLLATVSATTNSANPQSATNGSFPPGVGGMPGEKQCLCHRLATYPLH